MKIVSFTQIAGIVFPASQMLTTAKSFRVEVRIWREVNVRVRVHDEVPLANVDDRSWVCGKSSSIRIQIACIRQVAADSSIFVRRN